MSEVLEKAIATQLQSHLDIYNLHEPFQSGFRPLHSTETALLRVANNLLLASDTGGLSLFILLDLSSAFDIVCQYVLQSCLTAIDINGTVLQWLSSYLSDRQQFISINKLQSHSVAVFRGVPQGSVLGPLLFLIYMHPLGQIIRRHGLNFHSYADDTQIYLSAQPNSEKVMEVFPPPSITSSLFDLKTWMAQTS